MARQTVTATQIDGPVLEAETLTYMCTADRIAFERHFKVSSAVMAAWNELFDGTTGEPKPGADLKDVHEEWIAFFAWRALSRALNGAMPDFEGFIESLAEVKVGPPEEAANPTTAAPLSTS